MLNRGVEAMNRGLEIVFKSVARCAGRLRRCMATSIRCAGLREIHVPALLWGCLACCIPVMVSSHPPEFIEIRLAHENRNAFPWVYQEREDGEFVGEDIEIIREAARRVGVNVSFHAYPWMRALEEMRHGRMDGAFASSYVKEREKQGVYPMNPDATPDAERRLHMSGYALYMRHDADVHFDGRRFHHAPKGIAVQGHFSIARILREEFDYAPIEVGHADPAMLLRMALAGRVDATALQVDRADYLIREHPEFSGKIRKYRTDHEPFKQKPYFLMFSHQFHDAHADLVARFWDICAEIREERGTE